MRNFQTATKYQQYLKDQCIENAKQYASDMYEVTISHESVYDFNGMLSFVLNIQAKNRNSLLIITDKWFYVQIGRRGAVKSKAKDAKSFKRNKFLIFI